MAKLIPSSKGLSPTEVDRQMKLRNSVAEVEAFVKGDLSKRTAEVAEARIKALQQPGLIVETAATGPEGEQPLDGTTRPRNKKEAADVAHQAAANRPHTKAVPGINPPSTKEQLAARNNQIAAEVNTQFNNAVAEGIDEIMKWRDMADKIAGQEDKFTFTLPVKLSIVREGADFAVKVRLTPGAKRKIEREGSVHIANPADDLVDRANAQAG